MLDHDVGIAFLAKRIPECLAESARPSHPFLLTGFIFPVRWNAPMIELFSVDITDRAEFFAVFAALVIGHHCDCFRAVNLRELNRLRANSARTAPDQHGVA